MNILKLNSVIILSVFMILKCDGQRIDESQLKLIKKYKVKELQTFNHSLNGQNDSLLRTKITFNELGDIEEIIDYASINYYTYYENSYNPDFSLRKRITSFGQDKQYESSTIYKYDKHGNMKSEKILTNQETSFKVKYKYNQEHQLEERETTFHNKSKKTKELTKYTYNSLNQVVKIASNGYRYSSIELEYDTKGNHIKTDRMDRKGNRIVYLEKAYNDNNELKNQKEYHQYKRNFISILGEIKVKKGDVSVEEFFYSENGLVIMEKLFLNGKQVSFKKNKYVLQ